jgi:tripartite-type tricarboxylate transporter receptor subunit TctC
MSRKIIFLFLSLLLGAHFVPSAASSLDYPTREIELISGYPPGSSTDHVARLAAKFAEKYVGKPIIVVNKPGGGGSRGFASLAASKPDGYTLGIVSQSAILQPYLMKGVTFHYKKSFKIISQVCFTAEGVYVKKGGPWDMPFKDIVNKAKEKPHTIKAGVGGTWTASDVVRAILEDETGARFIRVPHPAGGQELIPAVLGGHLQFGIGEGSHWAPLYESGKFNVLAISTERRDPRFPNIPTLKEMGYDIALAVTFWVGAPAGTPDAIIHLLAEAFRKGVAEEGYKEGSDKAGNNAVWTGPADSMKTMERYDDMFQKLVKRHDLKPE